MPIDKWGDEPMTKQDLLVTLGVIFAILWVGDQKSVLRTLNNVKNKFGGLLASADTPESK